MAARENYGERVLGVEPYGAEAIPMAERHGRASSSFTLWASANLNILTWFTGSLGVSLGLSFTWAWKAILLGNALGAVFLGLTAAMGPITGEPQLISTRSSFGLRWARLPAGLNWITLMGWFGVDVVIGVFALQHLTALSYLPSLVLLAGLTVLAAVLGYNLMHLLARLTTIVLGVMFIVMTVLALLHAPAAARTGHGNLGLFILTTSISFAYLFSFAAVGSDYTRYLPQSASKWAVGGYSALGGFLVASWLELLGALTASLGTVAHPMAQLIRMMGAFAVPALLAVVASTVPVNSIALYSGALSSLAAGIPLRRWVAALVTGGVGTLLMVAGGGSFASLYRNFLLLLSYWIAPWLGIVLVDFYVHRHQGTARRGWPAALAFLVGIAASMPFMDSTLYQGFIAMHYLGGGDASYGVGMLVSALLYGWWGLAPERRRG